MLEIEMKTARRAANEAGKILKALFGTVKNISKKGEIDIVTEADIQSEEAVIDIIRNEFPQDSILSEEAGEDDIHGSERLWIIDPLDGTTNFAHGFPFFAVSIALKVKKKVVLGIVFNPVMDEFFEAVIDQGACLNREPIYVSTTKFLKDALLGTGFPYTIYEDSGEVIVLLKKMIVKVQGVRRAGAAAIDLCYVAAGRLDGFWEQGLKPWDTAAGSLILKEAGGRSGDFFGASYSPYQKTIVAGNPSVYRSMLKIIKFSNHGG